MSILSGLRRDWDGFPSEDGSALYYHDMREALRNPTDEQVDAIGEALLMTDALWAEQPNLKARRAIVRFVLAAAAGGDE